MPELPEVETVRRGLLPVLEGATIAKAEVNRPDLRWPFPPNMADRLTGATVTALRRRSKYILADLSTAETLIIHLGMSGRMLVEERATADFHHDASILPQHNHVVLHTTAGGRVTFNDARRFGAMDLWPTDDLATHWLLEKLGPEPLGNAFNETQFTAAIAGKASPIKSVLLDQRIVSGLGNIYVCEALHRAGISPKRKTKNLSTTRAASLVPIIRQVLSEAIEAGGSSLQDHRQPDGELGYFQHSFAVYDREGEACAKPDCSGTVTRIVQSGRSSFYCAQCQR